jgi:hypothetical protein
MSDSDARLWLGSQAPAEKTLAFLYCSSRPWVLREPSALNEVAADLIESGNQIARACAIQNLRSCRDREAALVLLGASPAKGQDDIVCPIRDFDKSTMLRAVLAFVASLDEKTVQQKWVQYRVLEAVRSKEADILHRIGSREGIEWERFYVTTAVRAWNGLDPKPDPAPSLVGARRSAVFLACAWNPPEPFSRGLLSAIRSSHPKMRRAALLTLLHFSRRFSQAETLPEGMSRVFREGLAGADSVESSLRRQLLILSASDSDDLFSLVESPEPETAILALEQFRTHRFRENIKKQGETRRLAEIVMRFCRSDDPQVRRAGFRHIWYIRPEHTDLYDAGLFVTALNDDDRHVVNGAIRAIRTFGSTQDRLELVELMGRGDQQLRSQVLWALGENPETEIRRALARYLGEVDIDVAGGIAEIVAPVAEEHHARQALQLLLGQTVEGRAKHYGAYGDLMKIIAKFPSLPSERQVLQIALLINSTLTYHKGLGAVLRDLRDPDHVDIALEALTEDKHLSSDLRDMLRRYLVRAGSRGWEGLAAIWFRLQPYDRERLIELIVLTDDDGRIREWLGESMTEDPSVALFCMAVRYSSWERRSRKPVAMQGLDVTAKNLAAHETKDVAKAVFFSLGFLSAEEAMEVWRRLVHHHPRDEHGYFPWSWGYEGVLRRNPDLALPLLKDRLKAGDSRTATTILRQVPASRVDEIADMIHPLLEDTSDHGWHRRTVYAKLFEAGDTYAAEHLGRRLLGGEDLSWQELRLLRYPTHRGIEEWLDRTSFWEEAAMTRRGFLAADGELLRKKGIACLVAVLEAGVFQGKEGELASRVVQLSMPPRDVAALPFPRFVEAYFEALTPSAKGSDTPPGLAELTEHADDQIACYALSLLCEHATGRAKFRNLAKSEKPWIAVNVVMGLVGSSDTGDLQVLTAALSHHSPGVRSAATWALDVPTQRDHPEVRSAQMALDEDEATMVRASAIYRAALPVEAVARFIEAPDVRLARAAVRRAAESRNARLLGPLYRAALLETAEEERKELALDAALAIEAFGGDTADALIANIVKERALRFARWAEKEDGGTRAPGSDPLALERQVLSDLLRLVNRLGGDTRATVLVGLLENKPFAREAAGMLLARGGAAERYFRPAVAHYLGLFESDSHVDLLDDTGRRLIQLVLQKTGVKRSGTCREEYAAAIRETVKALPRPPESVGQGFDAVPPAGIVLDRTP